MSSAPQKAVATNPPSGVPGQTTSGDTEPATNVDTVPIPFGVMAAQSGDGAIKLMSTADKAKLAGPVVLQHALSRNDQVSEDGVEPAATVTVGRAWRGWVFIEETVAVGDDVRFRHTAGGGEVAGAFRTSADSTDCSDISEFASWRTGGTAVDGAGVAELEIDMVGMALANPD